jgi:hypothetical protein
MLEKISTGRQYRPATHSVPDFNPMDLLPIFENTRQVHLIERQPKNEITSYLQQVSARLGNGFRHILRTADASQKTLDQALRLPEATGKSALLADISLLVNLYADLLDCPQVAIRLEVLQHAMCPRFHIDRTGIRLLCTYVGPGTEWLEEDFCNRAALKHTHTTLDAFHSELILHPQGVRQASPHALVLLKGSRWQGNDHAGVIHRSPEIQPGTTRVVLALDAIW